MNTNKIRISDAQNLLLQGLLSILCAAGIAFLTGFVQYLTEHGAVTSTTIGTALSVGIAAFMLTFVHATIAYVPSHAKEEMQAYKDTIAELQTAQQQPIAPVQAPQPVIVNITPTTPVQATVQAAPVSTPPRQQFVPAPPPVLASMVPETMDNPLTGFEVTNPTLPTVPKPQ